MIKPIAFLICALASVASAQSPASVAALLDSVVPAAMSAEQIPGAVVSVVSNGRVIFAKGYGLADMETRRPMTDSTIVRIGSTSKVMTAVAVAQLADRQRIRLDADVNQYLRRLKVPATYRTPLTAWQLLTHTAALDEIRPGTQADKPENLQSLDDFLRTRLVRYAPPGIATAYSTYGMTLAGLLVEDVSGQSFDSYLVQNVWRPLGMAHTSIAIPNSHRHLVAIPYDVENGKPVRAPWEWYHTTPASSVNSTASDMAKFMIAQLSPGSAIMSERMTREMQREQITMHPLLPGWGLGWQQIVRANGDRGVQHGGDVAGFSSLLTLLPARNFGIFVAGHREGSDLRFTVTRAVLNRLFPVPAAVTRPVSMHPSPAAAARAAARYAGHYRANIWCHSCANPRQMAEVDVIANADGTVSAFGGRFLEVSPRFFRSEDGERRFGFREDSLGRITHLTVGSWQVMERISAVRGSADSAPIRSAVPSVSPALAARNDALRREIQAMNDSMTATFSASDMGGVARFYTDDARVDGEGGDLVQGRHAVDAYWKNIRNPKSWKLEVIEVGGHPDHPYQIGRSTLVTSSPSGDRTSVVEFLAIWRREPNGSLRMAVDYYR
jgi:CubicO group peptidase (beta-lactamase class C family)/ketosteroid isomerase-like protein